MTRAFFSQHLSFISSELSYEQLNFGSFRTHSFKKVEFGNVTHVADCWKMEYLSDLECIGSHLISDNALKSRGGVPFFGSVSGRNVSRPGR